MPHLHPRAKKTPCQNAKKMSQAIKFKAKFKKLFASQSLSILQWHYGEHKIAFKYSIRFAETNSSMDFRNDRYFKN